MHLSVQCKVDVEIKNGTFWVVDNQDLTLNITGGTTDDYTSYVGNGTNGVRCNIDLINPIAIEEGAQNISGVISAKGYNTIKEFSSNINLDFTAVADATPALEISNSRDIVIKPNLKSRSNAINAFSSSLPTIATNLPEVFLHGEVPLYYLTAPILVGGECLSIDNPANSIQTTNSGQIRCIDTVVPATQVSRYKGTQVIDGRQQVQNIATYPMYSDLEAGDEFYSTQYGNVKVVGQFNGTVFQQTNFPATLDILVVDGLSTSGVQVGDIAIFRLSDSAVAPVNWSWAVVQVTKISVASNAFSYTPANPAGRTAITATGEDAISFFRITNAIDASFIKTARSGADAQYGGSIPAYAISYGGPLQLGAYHLWVDSSGRLRIKNGTPTSDTDGVVVGTQS
jgi:hypothetical protein